MIRQDSPAFVPGETVLVLVDIQKSFVSATMGGDQVLDRAQVVAKSARALDIPILATLQNPDRLGGIHPTLAEFAPEPIGKMAFSCWPSVEFRGAIEASGRKTVVLVGFEAHICIALTAHDLQRNGYRPIVLADAIASRTEDRYDLAIGELRARGIETMHSETLLYGLMEGADHPGFKGVLAAVKASRY